MKFQGKALSLAVLDDQIYHLIVDLQGESVNKFSSLVMTELESCLDLLEQDKSIQGLIISSAKDVFFVGADITEFVGLFDQGEEVIKKHIAINNKNFSRIEDLPFPTVCAINGYALGGGLEVALACDFRMASPDAKIGLPETKLGIIPGWGGTTRLPRIAGVDVAVEWIAGGADHSADQALKAGVIDGVVERSLLVTKSQELLRQAIAGKLNFKSRRQQKMGPLGHNDIEALLAFESSKAFIKAKAGRNYPAPVEAITAMQTAAKLSRDDALAVEAAAFAKLAQGEVAESLVGLFLADQWVGKKAKKLAGKVTSPELAAVLGAGIMGGGIAYQSALKGVPIVMKDIQQSGIDLGLKEATKLLVGRVDKGRMSNQKMADTLARIKPALSYTDFSKVDIVVEAVVENPKIKHAVLAEVEGELKEGAVLCSNTSTISIDYLAEPLKKPENFCGMHFFNPVHRMPLVEVIRGTKTSDETVAKTVAYANQLGKKAIVVNDCPGFLVNRVLFPYFAGFSMLLRDGADFLTIDKLMERWGWPMGPAYLMDVVGIDTGVHAEKVMAQGFPERMARDYVSAADKMFELSRFGQKNKQGFYEYTPDKKGKLQKNVSQEGLAIVKNLANKEASFEDEEVIARMMIPMATELARCLEEKVVASPVEADLALIYGLGFPPFRGGVFKWIDRMGVKNFIELTKKYQHLGPLYEPTQGMLDMAKNDTKYYAEEVK